MNSESDPTPADRSMPGQSPRKRRINQAFAWMLYDFGNSAYPTVITTAVYVLYFKGVVCEGMGPGESDKLWGYGNSAAALLVFLLGPTLGYLADQGGKKRQFFRILTFACAIFTAGLAMTGPGTVALALGLVILSGFAMEAANIFYNAFLPDLAKGAQLTTLSARAWAFGYIGGLLCLLAVLPMVTEAETTAANMPWVILIVASWYLLFTSPALLRMPEPAALTNRDGKRPSLNPIQTLRHLGSLPDLRRFLLPFFFYMNALNAIYVFAAAFAVDALGFSVSESVVLIMLLNIVAAPGALLFARLAHPWGLKRALLLAVFLWIVTIVLAILVAWPGLMDPLGLAPAQLRNSRIGFWVVAVLASLCIGSTQSLSRTFIGRLAPPGRSAEFFGFMAFSGRGSAILGPLAFGLVSSLFDGDKRWALATMGAFFIVGFVGLLRVREPHVDGPDPA
jgi:MFS transporter, UMF1 family